MLLQEFDINRMTKINKINSYLTENHGFKLDTTADKSKLIAARVNIRKQLSHLRVMENLDPKDAEYTKAMMVLEGLELLITESVITERSGPGSNRYNKIVSWLSDFVVKNVEVGDDFDAAITQAMQEYRSSKWRFADYEVEHDLRNTSKERIRDLDIAEGQDEVAINKEDMLILPETKGSR